MGVIDFIFNVTALLAWLQWRSLRFDPMAHASAATLAGTLRPADDSRRLRSWEALAFVPVTLVLRLLFCLYLAAPAGWNPRISLYFVVLAFRGDAWGAALAFAILDFLKLLIIVHFWALILTVINRSVADTDSLVRLLRLQLGKLARWPGWVSILTFLSLVVALWILSQPILAKVGVLSHGPNLLAILLQGLLVGLSLVLTLKYLLPVFLLLHFVSSHVYLGSGAFWNFISATARNLLKPLSRFPLQFGKLDLAPLVGCVLILIPLEILPRVTLMLLKGRTLWPQ